MHVFLIIFTVKLSVALLLECNRLFAYVYYMQLKLVINV